MGACQNGRCTVVVSSQRDDLAACVVFYGAAPASDRQVTEYQPRPLGEMLAALSTLGPVRLGEADNVISLDDVLRVRGALEAGKRSYRMRVLPDVPRDMDYTW